MVGEALGSALLRAKPAYKQTSPPTYGTASLRLGNAQRDPAATHDSARSADFENTEFNRRIAARTPKRVFVAPQDSRF